MKFVCYPHKPGVQQRTESCDYALKMQEGSILCLTDEYVAGLASEDYAQVMKNIRLSGEHKCQLARDALEDTAKDITFAKKDFTSIITDLKITQEDLKITLGQIKRFRKYLQTQVVSVLDNPHRKLEARDAFMRYHKRILKDLDSTTEKLKTANINLSARYKDLVRSIHEFEASGEVIHAIDAEELRIQSKTAAAEMATQYLQHGWLKAVCARTTRALERSRATLSNEIRMTAEMSRRLKSLDEQNANIRDEIDRLRDSQTVLQRQLDYRKAATQNYKLPTIGDWVELYITNRTVDKKVQIQATDLKNAKSSYERHKQLWAQVKRGI
ncbi:unnamed protein product [Dicrocoelium dendriticum]|nr:unnamed protein product [Dicrocoelium dendriticum]